MTMETTYTDLREKLATYLDKVIDDREVLVVRRRGARDVAIISVDDLSGLLETAYLLRSPKNAERLLQALVESKENDKKRFPKKSAATHVEELRRFAGLEARPGSRDSHR